MMLVMWVFIVFTSMSKFISAFLIAYICVCSSDASLVLYILLDSSLINELNKIFDRCLFYVCMRIMMISIYLYLYIL